MSDYNPRAVLEDDETWLTIAQDFLGHPSEWVSPEELGYMNPSLSESMLRHNLHGMLLTGVIARAKLPVDQRDPDQPCVFYRLTDDAREVLEDDLFSDSLDTIRQDFDNVEWPAEFARCMDAPRPGDDAHVEPGGVQVGDNVLRRTTTGVVVRDGETGDVVGTISNAGLADAARISDDVLSAIGSLYYAAVEEEGVDADELP